MDWRRSILLPIAAGGRLTANSAQGKEWQQQRKGSAAAADMPE